MVALPVVRLDQSFVAKAERRFAVGHDDMVYQDNPDRSARFGDRSGCCNVAFTRFGKTRRVIVAKYDCHCTVTDNLSHETWKVDIDLTNLAVCHDRAAMKPIRVEAERNCSLVRESGKVLR